MRRQGTRSPHAAWSHCAAAGQELPVCLLVAGYLTVNVSLTGFETLPPASRALIFAE